LKAFTHAMKSLGTLDSEAVATLLAAAADVTLVLDHDGVIRDMSFHGEALAHDLAASAWPGRSWSDVVSQDSRAKVGMLLREATGQAASRWRHVNHPIGADGQLPVLYSTVRFGARGQVMAFGRDLRAVSELQQRLVDAQQTLEQDYARLRHVETRYRLLFQMAAEAVLVLDAATLRVNEANPAAQALFGDAGRRLLGRGIGAAFDAIFDAEAAAAVQALLQGVRGSGQMADAVIARADGTGRLTISASLFREASGALLLVRIAAGVAPSAPMRASSPPTRPFWSSPNWLARRRRAARAWSAGSAGRG
jgi:transcriptional regulator PpsR